jgi:multidrug efflux pump subunit AcrA (membrane-fusion protein)
VEPHLATTLSTEIAGLTLRFDLKEGDAVQEGQTVVVQLKATDFDLTLVEAQAELSKAKQVAQKLKRGLRPEEIDEKRAEVQERKTWMEKYAKDLERANTLRTRAISSVSDYDLVESTYFAAKAQYERAQQSLRVAELGTRQEDIAAAEAEVQRLQAKVQRLHADVQKTTVYAPVSGVITQRYTEVGQWIERGDKVADLIDLRVIFVRVPIHEKDIGRVRVGDTATVSLDAFPDRTFDGRVKHIIPQADAASRTFPVKIEVANTPDNALKAGMSARVRLRSGAAHPTVLVPKDAVVRWAGKQIVFVVQDEKARMIPIKPGRTYNGSVEVLEGGLKPGDIVVVTGNETLRDEAAVVIKGEASH